jgi:hypothetical protein
VAETAIAKHVANKALPAGVSNNVEVESMRSIFLLLAFIIDLFSFRLTVPMDDAVCMVEVLEPGARKLLGSAGGSYLNYLKGKVYLSCQRYVRCGENNIPYLRNSLSVVKSCRKSCLASSGVECTRGLLDTP